MRSLGRVEQLAQVVLLVGLLPVLVLTVQVMKNRPRVAWCSVFGILGVSAFTELPGGTIGPLSIDPLDLSLAAVFIAAVWRLHEQRRWPTALIVLTVVFALNIVRSFTTFGIGQTDMAFRFELFFITAALFGATVAPESFHRLLRDVRKLAYVLVASLLARWIGLVEPIEGAVTTEAFFENRAVPAIYAATMATGLVYSLWSWLNRYSSRHAAIATIVLAAAVVLTRHRSVWVSTLLAVLVVLTLAPRGHRRYLAIGVASASSVIIASLGSKILPDLTQTLSQSAQDRGTWEWRIDAWLAMWEQHRERGPVSLVLGSSYGNPWDRNVADPGRVGYSPHNFYVRVSIRLGLVSTIAVFGLYLRTLITALKRHSTVGALIVALLIQQLAYAIPYDPDVTMAFVFGACTSYMVSTRSVRPTDSGHCLVTTGRAARPIEPQRHPAQIMGNPAMTSR